MGAVTLKELREQKKDRLELRLISGESGTARKVSKPSVYIFNPEPDFWKGVEEGAIVIVGRDGLSDFASSCAASNAPHFDEILRLKIPCVVFSEVNFLPRHMILFSETHAVPFFTSKFDQFLLRSRILGFLREKIQGIATSQGVFVNVFGVGIIIKGESGLGKTECALELVTRGHQIISDDLIELHRNDNRSITGRSPDISRNLLYIKGMGIINIRELYGPGSVLDDARVDIIVEFVEWSKDIDIMGHGVVYTSIMDVNVPQIRIPVRPNQMTTIIEVVAKRFLLSSRSQEK